MISRTIIAFLLLPSLCFAGDSVADLPKKAIERSQLTLPGSPPFHLKATIYESTDRDNDSHNATIEEYWLAPDKWTRTVTAKEFSQTITVNGEKTAETISGDYYPAWLRNLVQAMFEPGERLKALDLTASSDDPILRNPRVPTAQFCRRFSFRAGVPPSNNIFSSFCFNNGLLESVMTPGYSADYSDFKKFGEKKVARRISEYLKPGEKLEARIDDLEELDSKDESRFDATTVTAPLQTIDVPEATVRSMVVSSSEIKWPTIKDGKPVGVLSLRVYLDRTGKVREVSALNSDNPFMSDAARESVLTWQFKPATSKGTPVQISSILTFSYQTKIVK